MRAHISTLWSFTVTSSSGSAATDRVYFVSSCTILAGLYNELCTLLEYAKVEWDRVS